MAEVKHGGGSGEQLVVTSDKTQAYGLSGNDTIISGGNSSVLLIGGSGDDSLVMFGGTGTLNGGKGSDTFEFTYSATKSLSAVIEDFVPSSDKIIVNFDGASAPQLTSEVKGNDVVLKDSDGLLNVTLKGVRENDYFDGNASEQVWEVLELTNAEREAQGLSALTLSEGLMQGASIRADEITEKGKLGLLTDHTRLDNKTGWITVFDEIGKQYSDVGENLDGGASSPEAVVITDWMNSDAHRENILKASYQKIGIGYKEDDPDPTNLRFYWTQEFAKGLSSSEKVTVSTAELSTANITTNTVSKAVLGTANADEITNTAYGATIDALGGDDRITNTGAIASISGGTGKDTIENGGANATINAGVGDDSISLASGAKEILIQYNKGDGSDTISGFNETDTISISGIEFTPEIIGDDIVLTVGDDSIKFLGAASIAYNFLDYIDGYWSGVIVVNEGNYQHIFDNDMESVTIKALSGDNTITNGYYGDYVSIDCGAGNDSILNNGYFVTLNTSGGNDTISNIAGSRVSITSGSGNDIISNILGSQVTIDAGDGNDTVDNNIIGDFATISAGTGNDSVKNSSASVLIDGGSGNDTIWGNSGNNVTINCGAGNDYIISYSGASVSIDGGAGNETIQNSGSNVTINGGDDNDKITNSSTNVSINGGADNDTVSNSGSNVTINGGRGNDRIELSDNAQNNLILYNDGDGKDEVWGFNATDTIRIGDGTGTYFPETINGHLFINVGTGYIALGNGASLSANDIVEGVPVTHSEETLIIYFSKSEPAYSNTLDNVIISALDDDYSDHSIANSGANVSIIPGESYNTITNTGENVYIEGNSGHNLITNTGNNVQIYNDFDSPSDTVDNSGNNVLILSGYEKDYIVNSGDNAYILARDDDDLIELSGDAQNNVIAYVQGDGDDTVRGFNETDTLLVNVVSSYSKQTVGNDIIVNFNGGGSVTLEDAATLESVNIIANWYRGNSITMHINNGSVTFEGTGVVEGNAITFGEGDDSYVNAQPGMSIQAFGGNDTIMNFRAVYTKDNVTISPDNVTIAAGAGNDLIVSYGNTVSINGGSDDDTLVSIAESDVTIDGGAGNDSIVNGTASGTASVSIDGGAGDDTIETYGSYLTINGGEGNDSIKNSGDNSRIDSGTGDDYVYNKGGKNVTIVSGAGDDALVNGGESVTIDASDGADTINNSGSNTTIFGGTGDDSVFSSGASSIIDLGAGNDFIHNRGNDVSINLGDDDDTLRTDASNVTIEGGLGNDRISLESGAKNVLIQYNPGDGNDTIWGLDENSNLRIGDGTATYSSTVRGDDVILTVGEGKITLKDFRDKPEHIIIGESGTEGGGSGSGGSGSGGSGGDNGGGSNPSGGGSQNEGKGDSEATPGKSASGKGGSASNNNTSDNTSSGGRDKKSIAEIIADLANKSTSSTTPTANTSNNSISPTTQPTPIINATGYNSTDYRNYSATANTATPSTTPTTTTQQTPATVAQHVYAGGDQVIDNYTSGEKIALGTLPTGYIFNSGNFALTTAAGTLFIANANDKVIEFTDGAGNTFAKAYSTTNPGLIDGRGIGGFEVIAGSDIGSDLIFAGDGGSSLWGGNDIASDTLVGGNGVDIFVGGKNQGADTFINASANDVVFLSDSTLNDVIATAGNDNAVAVAFNTGNVVMVGSSEPLSAAFMLADGSAYRYNHVTKSWQTA